MASRWPNARWWQTLAGALAVGMLAGGAILWITDGADVRPEVTEERPPASVRVTYLPGTDDAATARITCAGDEVAEATGAWAEAPQRACRALYAAAPAVLADASFEDRECPPRLYEDRPFTVYGEIGDESVSRIFTVENQCAFERWQAARVLIDPWLELESSELDAG